MTMTDTERGLMQAVLDSPQDDLPRLVYADWLEENAGEVKCERCGGEGFLIDNRSMFSGTRIGCPGCKCRDCDGKGDYLHPTHYRQPCKTCDGKGGTGTVSDGRAERGEFIRVQVELAVAETCKDCFRFGECTPHRKLRQRERDLFDKHKCEWFGESRNGILYLASEIEDAEGQYETALKSFVSKGFISSVCLPFAAWVGGECENCGGTGLVDGDRWEQSEPCPDCGGEFGPGDEYNPRGVEPGTGRTPGIGGRLVREWPIERVECIDKEPWQWSRSGRFGWFLGDERVGLLRLGSWVGVLPGIG